MEQNIFFKIKVFDILKPNGLTQDNLNPMVEVTRPDSRILGRLIVPLATHCTFG